MYSSRFLFPSASPATTARPSATARSAAPAPSHRPSPRTPRTPSPHPRPAQPLAGHLAPEADGRVLLLHADHAVVVARTSRHPTGTPCRPAGSDDRPTGNACACRPPATPAIERMRVRHLLAARLGVEIHDDRLHRDSAAGTSPASARCRGTGNRARPCTAAPSPAAPARGARPPTSTTTRPPPGVPGGKFSGRSRRGCSAM